MGKVIFSGGCFPFCEVTSFIWWTLEKVWWFLKVVDKGFLGGLWEESTKKKMWNKFYLLLGENVRLIESWISAEFIVHIWLGFLEDYWKFFFSIYPKFLFLLNHVAQCPIPSYSSLSALYFFGQTCCYLGLGNGLWQSLEMVGGQAWVSQGQALGTRWWVRYVSVVVRGQVGKFIPLDTKQRTETKGAIKSQEQQIVNTDTKRWYIQ